MFENDNIVLIMRHAKSDWPGYVTRDFDRPLDEQGEAQPLEIADELNSMNITIEHAVVSSALRTFQTFELLTQKLSKRPQSFFERRLYNAKFTDAIEVLREHSGLCRSILLIGHNPAVSELTYNLTNYAHEFKPASLVILQAKRKNLTVSLDTPRGFRLEKILVPRF